MAKRRACWVTRQQKKESRRVNGDDGSLQASTAEGTHLLCLASTICTIFQEPWPQRETLLAPVGGFICFVISLLKPTFSITIAFFIIIIISLLLVLHHCCSSKSNQRSNIFLHHSNASITVDHWVKKWSRGFLPLWECNFKQQYFTSDAAKVHLEGILHLSSAWKRTCPVRSGQAVDVSTCAIELDFWAQDIFAMNRIIIERSWFTISLNQKAFGFPALRSKLCWGKKR